MNTEAQKTIQPSTELPACVTGDFTQTESYKKQSAENDARRGEQFLPTLSELRITDEDISANESYWAGIRDAVAPAVREWETALKNAQDLIDELKAAAATRPLTRLEKVQLRSATENVSRAGWRLKRDSNRLTVAKNNVKTWAARRKDFDENERPRMLKLEREAKKLAKATLKVGEPKSMKLNSMRSGTFGSL